MVEMSENIDQLAAAHSGFLSEIRDVAKDQDGYGYKYADLAQLLEMSRPLLAGRGLSLVQWPSFVPYQTAVQLPEVKGFVPYLVGDVSLETVLMHESGQWMRSSLSLPVETKKGLSVAQCVGMAITYGRRYSAASVLQIAQADDDAAHAPAQNAGGNSAQPSAAARARVISADEVRQLDERVRAIGRDPASFARAVANVAQLSQLPEAKRGAAVAMLEKAEAAYARRQSDEPAEPDDRKDRGASGDADVG